MSVNQARSFHARRLAAQTFEHGTFQMLVLNLVPQDNVATFISLVRVTFGKLGTFLVAELPYSRKMRIDITITVLRLPSNIVVLSNRLEVKRAFTFPSG